LRCHRQEPEGAGPAAQYRVEAVRRPHQHRLRLRLARRGAQVHAPGRAGSGPAAHRRRRRSQAAAPQRHRRTLTREHARMTEASRQRLHGLLWISPWIIGTLVFLALPVAMSAYYSLTDYSLIESPVYIGAENYKEMAHDAVFWTSLKNTGIY